MLAQHIRCSASNEVALGPRSLLVWYLMTREWALCSLSGRLCPINVLAPERWKLPVDHWSFLKRGQKLCYLIGIHVDLLISLHWIYLKLIRVGLHCNELDCSCELDLIFYNWCDVIWFDYNQRPITHMFMFTCSHVHWINTWVAPCLSLRDVTGTVTSR